MPDASVWSKQAIARPPSRQKPPPEALHLFSGDVSMWQGESVRRKGRPHTAVGTMRRPCPAQPRAPPAGSLANLTSMRRPVSRHRPPPESLDLRAVAAA